MIVSSGANGLEITSGRIKDSECFYGDLRRIASAEKLYRCRHVLPFDARELSTAYIYIPAKIEHFYICVFSSISCFACPSFY